MAFLPAVDRLILSGHVVLSGDIIIAKSGRSLVRAICRLTTSRRRAAVARVFILPCGTTTRFVLSSSTNFNEKGDHHGPEEVEPGLGGASVRNLS